MLFSIIIPTYHRNDLLTRCLQRLQPGVQSLDADWYEVIVTDDAANPATEELLRTQFPWAAYTAGPQRGPAANRNHGASLASGQWLVFTDDDCLPDANWLQAYHDAITGHPDCRAFEGAILPDDWKLLQKDLAECPVNTAGGCFWSANIMVERQLFQSMGGFDEQFLIAAQEDQDLQWRIQQQHSIVFVPAAQVLHPVRFKKLWKSLRECKRRAKNHELLAKKIAAAGRRSFNSRQHQLNGIKFQTRVLIQQIRLLHPGHAGIALFTTLSYYVLRYLRSFLK